MDILGRENVCKPAVKYKFSKKLNCWVRTWFDIEYKKVSKQPYFKQNNAFSKDRSTDWSKWSGKPV
jgi:hypothetical protein